MNRFQRDYAELGIEATARTMGIAGKVLWLTLLISPCAIDGHGQISCLPAQAVSSQTCHMTDTGRSCPCYVVATQKLCKTVLRRSHRLAVLAR